MSRAPLGAERIYEAIFESGRETGDDTGRLSTAEFLDRLRQRFSLTGTDADIAQAWSDIFTPNHGITRSIRDLKSRGVRLVPASNTNALHHEWFAGRFADTMSALDAQVFSYQVGSRKPERLFLRRVPGRCAVRAG